MLSTFYPKEKTVLGDLSSKSRFFSKRIQVKIQNMAYFLTNDASTMSSTINVSIITGMVCCFKYDVIFIYPC